MVFVKVRETYDLHTVQNKMTVIGIHTPRPDILKLNYPGLLMQCKAYRPVSCDVRIACASTLPVDPQGVGLAEGDVAPEDLFNPILYKAISNVGMSQLEARIIKLNTQSAPVVDINGDSVVSAINSATGFADEFDIYYGLLSETHGWKHANPQSGLEMKGLVPYVYETLYNYGDNGPNGAVGAPGVDGGDDASNVPLSSIRGKAQPVPFMNCTAYTRVSGPTVDETVEEPGFPFLEGGDRIPTNAEVYVPYINAMCGVICVPPSRLHELFYRMVVEWTIEFSGIRPLGEITSFYGLDLIGKATHYQNYDYSATKKALVGSDETIMDDSKTMVDANVPITKVM